MVGAHAKNYSMSWVKLKEKKIQEGTQVQN